ncbi:putative diguanylate cyclase YegE [Pseudidiomarina piscicola]|uniref:diguanylate cyclase n=1 Tax=Pseudidiomarina piscicola TaxID=2614830 RepID=A0A6S6WP95_9GAMM|nr:GGDEF domain-containing protein [Pseudidiomarina piscicola]CAB0151369.1 putative diguanylate cyclase YegE [Pseudidiomarina piscicola]VZT40850.1 putative diguanylate cyclase YegE [Pseudomonas aeruginosa]
MDIITIIVLTGLTNLTFALYSWQQVSNPESHAACKPFAQAQLIKAVSYFIFAASLYHALADMRLIANLLIFIGCWAEARAYIQLAGTKLRGRFWAIGIVTTCAVFTWMHYTSGDNLNNIMIVTSSVLLLLPIGTSAYALYQLYRQHPGSAFARVLLTVNSMMLLFCIVRAPVAATNPDFYITQRLFMNQAFMFATFIFALGNGIGFIGFLKERSDQKLRQRADVDYLTAIYNRQCFEKLTKEKLKSGASFSLYFLDIDKFKSVNDRFGHAAGDQALRCFGKLLRNKQEKHHGIVGRLGGEEFGLLLPQSTASSHQQILQTLRDNFAAETQTLIGEPLTFSLGYCTSNNAASLHELMHKADILLYAAKAELAK